VSGGSQERLRRRIRRWRQPGGVKGDRTARTARGACPGGQS